MISARRSAVSAYFALFACAACAQGPVPVEPATASRAAPSARNDEANVRDAEAAPTPPAPTPPAAMSDAQRRVAEFLARVGVVRRLAPLAPVEAKVLDRAALIANVREHVEREIPAEVLRNQGEMLIALGLLPVDYDYQEGSFELLKAQLAGFYEPHDKRMYLAADLVDRAADATLAHELLHALQDQHYDLGARLTYKREANDQQSAVQGLAEGDATSAMMDLILAEHHNRAVDVPDDVFAAEVEGSMSATPETANVPRVLRASLVDIGRDE